LVEACEIGNPSRLYYLKQEVKDISLTGLMEIAIAVFETECEIKQGLEPSKLKERFLIMIKLD
jgi:DNA polymerase III delta subunit